MNIDVRLFAVAKQQAGCDAIKLNLPVSATIADVRRRLLEVVPGLAPLADHLMFAVNGQYASDSDAVDSDSEIACIPPVSGG